MKLLIVLGLVAVAIGAWSESNTRGFEHGKQYQFEWKGQVASGLAIEGSSQHSVQQIHSRVILNVHKDSTFWLRLDEPRMLNGQHRLVEPRLFKQLSLDEAELTSEHKQLLALPVRFRFNNGILSEIQFAEKDQAWSENIKRALLNMLQVNLSADKKSDYSNQNHFTAQENTLEGECEVAYTLNKDLQKDQIEVTKSINFDKCSKRVDTRYNYRFGDECPECETSQDRIPESQTVINYKLSGPEERFLIKEVELKSEYVFAPLNKEQKMLASYVNHKLTLIDVSGAERLEEPLLAEESSLIYNYEREMAREAFWMTGDDKQWKKAGFDHTNKVEQVERYLKQLVKNMESDKTGIEIQATHEFSRIAQVLRKCSRKEVQQIHQSIFESDKYEQKTLDDIRTLISDALAVAGTKVTVEHLVEKITNKQIGVIKGSHLLKAIVNTPTPSVQIVELLIRLSKSEAVLRNPVLRQSCLLTLGALMNGVCGNNQDKMTYELEDVVLCTRQQKSEWVDFLHRTFKESASQYEKVLTLKTIANAGIDVSVHLLENIIYDRQQEKLIRVQAMDALRQLRTEMPLKIQKMLLPLYKSRTEQPEIRMTAVHHILHSLPERVVIDQIVEQMNRERNQQVISFTHSLLKSFVQSKNPCERQISENVEVALRMLSKKVELSSRHFHLPLYSKLTQLGASFDVSSIFSNESVIPKELLASLDSLQAGQWNKNLIQIGFSQQNVDYLLNRVLSHLDRAEKVEDIVRGRRSSAQKPIHKLRKMIKNLKIESSSSSEESSYAMMYLRYKNLDYAVIPFDEETVTYVTKNLFRNGKFDLSEIESLLAKGIRFNTKTAAFFMESSRTIVTSLGMPLRVQNKLPTVMSIEGHLKVEREDRHSSSWNGLQLRLVAVPTMAVTYLCEMLLVTPLAHSGVRMTHSLQFNPPIDTTVQFDWERFQLKTVIKTNDVEKRLFLIETRPTSFVRRAQGGRFTTAEKTIFVDKMDTTTVHYEQAFGQDLLGLEWNVFGSVHRHLFDKETPEAFLVGENHIEVRIVPTEKRVREFVFELEAENPKHTTLKSAAHYDRGFALETFTTIDGEEHDFSSEKRDATIDYYNNLKLDNYYNNRLVLKVHTIGGPQHINFNAELLTSCEKNLRYCKTVLNAKRSPMFDEPREWELMTKIQTVLPNIPSTLEQYSEQQFREAQVTIDGTWGCEEKNNGIRIRIQADQDLQMKNLVRDMMNDKKTTGLNQHDVLLKASQLNQYKMYVQRLFRPSTVKTMKQAYDLFKSYFLFSGEISSIAPLEPNNMVRFLMKVDPENRRLINLTIETTEERFRLRNIDTYIRLPLINVAQPTEIKEIRKMVQTAECEVKSTKVNSFDNLIYKAPITTCYSVLAKDCSEEPQFAVLMKKLSQSGEEKKMKIISEDNVFELEVIDEQIVCTINGKFTSNEHRLREHGLKKINEQLFEIELEHVTVRFDGYSAQIRMSHVMQTKQCGLCGHFDGQSDNDFRRADNDETDDLEEFHRSWLAHDSECEMEEDRLSEKKNYRIMETVEEEEEYRQDKYETRNQETVEPKLKTLIMERHSHTCFSVEPVRECENSEMIATSEKKRVTFSCLPKHDRVTRQLVDTIRRESVVEIEDQKNTMVERIQLPKMCYAY